MLTLLRVRYFFLILRNVPPVPSRPSPLGAKLSARVVASLQQPRRASGVSYAQNTVYYCWISISWFNTALSTKLPKARTVESWIDSSPFAPHSVRTNDTSCGPISSALVRPN